MKEYKLAIGWRIFLYIVAPLFSLLMIWVILMPLFPGTKDSMSSGTYWIVAPICIGMIVLMVLAVLDTNKAKFVITHDKVYSIGLFSYKELLFSEIKGYRLSKEYIFIEPTEKGTKRIKITTYIGKKDELIEWLSSYYHDLDILQAQQEEQEILSNEEFGWDEEQRMQKLKNAHKITKAFNWLGGIVGAWTLFWPKPYDYAVNVSIIIPIIAIIIQKLSGGIIKIANTKNSPYPDIFWAILAPSMALCLRALFDYNIFDYSNLWMSLLALGLLFTGLLATGNKEIKFKQVNDYLAILGLMVFSFGYAYGTVICLNGVYDKSEPQIYTAKIVSKRVSSGKTRTYYFEVTPWGPQKQNEEVTVSSELYNKHTEGDQVAIYFKKGLFEIPWFVVAD